MTVELALEDHDLHALRRAADLMAAVRWLGFDLARQQILAQDGWLYLDREQRAAWVRRLDELGQDLAIAACFCSELAARQAAELGQAEGIPEGTRFFASWHSDLCAVTIGASRLPQPIKVTRSLSFRGVATNRVYASERDLWFGLIQAAVRRGQEAGVLPDPLPQPRPAMVVIGYASTVQRDLDNYEMKLLLDGLRRSGVLWDDAPDVLPRVHTIGTVAQDADGERTVLTVVPYRLDLTFRTVEALQANLSEV